MDDRKNVEAKLATASTWVREEFAFIGDVMAELECKARDESGPGRAFRLGDRPIVRVHPKRKLIGLGFPASLRDEIDAMTNAVRAQRGATWLNYEPGSWDRDTIEALIDKSVHATKSKSIGTTTVDGSRPPDLQPLATRIAQTRDDDADLTLILTVLRAFKQHEQATGARSTLKVLREAIFFRWEAPRLPPGGKYSPAQLHSPAARERRTLGLKGGLVYEHVRPISTVIRQLLDNLPANEAELRTVLETSADRVIIAKTEDDALNAAGVRAEAPDDEDPWGRHRAAGLDPTTYAPWI